MVVGVVGAIEVGVVGARRGKDAAVRGKGRSGRWQLGRCLRRRDGLLRLLLLLLLLLLQVLQAMLLQFG